MDQKTLNPELPRGIWLRKICFFFTLFAGFYLLANSADARDCNCSRKLGDCVASGSLVNETLTLHANTDRCAQIIYYVDGQPSSMTIQDGNGSTDFFRTNNKASRHLEVGSCSVCSHAAKDKFDAEFERSTVTGTPAAPAKVDLSEHACSAVIKGNDCVRSRCPQFESPERSSCVQACFGDAQRTCWQ